MQAAPIVDINLFVHNGATTVDAAIDSVRAQSWQDWRLTLIDDGSTDGTWPILQAHAASDPRIRLHRNRCNAGAVGAFQRGVWFGDADYVMPKSADDLIAPDFISDIMQVLLQNPTCVMCHAAGLSFERAGEVRFLYPSSHNLDATQPDPIDRAAHVMWHYTSSPSFWGIYRRDAVDRLAPIAHRAGWDHVLLAELALHGDIRHVQNTLFWRRGSGRDLRDLARAATPAHARGLSPDDLVTDQLWRMPCITTAFAHLENFALARLPRPDRERLLALAGDIFRRRWGAFMQRELLDLPAYVDAVAAELRTPPAEAAAPITRAMMLQHLLTLLGAVAMVLPNADLAAPRRIAADLLMEKTPCRI